MRKLPASGLPGGPVSDRTQASFRASAAAKPTAGAFVVCLAVLLSGCTGDATDAPTGSITGTGTSTGNGIGTGPGNATPPEVVARLDLQLDIPWAAVFLPNGTAIISERDSAQLKAVRDGKAATIGQVPGVAPGGEGGLLGLALSPGFPSDNYLYLYFTSAQDNRIARLKLMEQPDGSLDLGDPEMVFSGIPKASTHNGGRIRFGPDGFLYVGTGDSQRREQPQDRNALGGKILRLTPEGDPAPGNPFGNAVYSLGHRNVQGLAWDSAGRLWSSEFGPDVNDELNLIEPGANYGWPAVTGAPHREGYRDAKVVWPSTADSSPSGLEIAGSTAYLGALRGQRLWTVSLSGEEASAPVAYFTREYGRIRDVIRTPDGGFWLLTNNKNPDFVLVLAPHG
ncbi:PQQ-dependent sugar dehydrogenase [Pseudarthrobacter sp. SSS035]|uniref:PQQ-dependent sugar dehydrogenase n=1 Tax=Pseudarthrobacter sp. SSS035 TaxID=2931399 RepID=UPI00200BEAEC|nr:PQQ-dependent sugar dehydrogenase [Pseudarthrobacter sp. SSS035]